MTGAAAWDADPAVVDMVEAAAPGDGAADGELIMVMVMVAVSHDQMVRGDRYRTVLSERVSALIQCGYLEVVT